MHDVLPPDASTATGAAALGVGSFFVGFIPIKKRGGETRLWRVARESSDASYAGSREVPGPPEVASPPPPEDDRYVELRL